MITVKKKRVTRDSHGYSKFNKTKSSAPGYESEFSSYESVKSFSDNYINICLENAFLNGYEYAQREFSDEDEDDIDSPMDNTNFAKQAGLIGGGAIALGAASNFYDKYHPAIDEAKNRIQREVNNEFGFISKSKKKSTFKTIGRKVSKLKRK